MEITIDFSACKLSLSTVTVDNLSFMAGRSATSNNAVARGQTVRRVLPINVNVLAMA